MYSFATVRGCDKWKHKTLNTFSRVLCSYSILIWNAAQQKLPPVRRMPMNSSIWSSSTDEPKIAHCFAHCFGYIHITYTFTNSLPLFLTHFFRSTEVMLMTATAQCTHFLHTVCLKLNTTVRTSFQSSKKLRMTCVLFHSSLYQTDNNRSDSFKILPCRHQKTF